MGISFSQSHIILSLFSSYIPLERTYKLWSYSEKRTLNLFISRTFKKLSSLPHRRDDSVKQVMLYLPWEASFNGITNLILHWQTIPPHCQSRFLSETDLIHYYRNRGDTELAPCFTEWIRNSSTPTQTNNNLWTLLDLLEKVSQYRGKQAQRRTETY